MGNRTKEEVFDAGNNVVQRKNRVFDSLSRLATELNAANTAIASYTYDNNGRLNSLTYPSAKVVGYTYDAQGRIASIAVNGADVAQSGS